MSGNDFIDLQEALLYVFYPVLVIFLALVIAGGVLSALLMFFGEYFTPRSQD